MQICTPVLSALVIVTIGLGTVQPVKAQPEELPLGSQLPALDQPLQRIDGTSVPLSKLTGSTATVLLFWSNQCPWVRKYEGRVSALIDRFSGQSVQFVLINSNDASAFPQESLDASRQRAEEANYSAPYVRDPGSALARALGASRTPHVFVFDSSQTLVYTGAIDDSPSDPERTKTAYLREALTALTSNQEIDVPQTKAFGCTIKYQQ